MAKAEDRQLAKCIGIEEYTDKKGKARYSYRMDLEGEEFTIPETKYFKAEVDKFYFPVVFIAEYARVSQRTGNAYIARVPSVAWHEVK